MTGELTDRRGAFDAVAERYDSFRPGHPDQVFDDLERLSGSKPQARVLEIGCGTGHATEALAARGYRIRAIELGAGLAEVARARLRRFPAVDVEVGAFEDAPVAPGCADLVVCASAFHWLDRGIAYPKIARALVPGGALALFWSARDSSRMSIDFHRRERSLMALRAPELLRCGSGGAESLMKVLAPELRSSPLWADVILRDYRWELIHDSSSYVAFLSTLSDFIALPAERRERLFRGLREVIRDEFADRVVLPMYTSLFLAIRSGT